MKIPEPSFTLKEPNSKQETLLNMKVYLNYKRITISTGVKIPPTAWSKEDGSPINDKKVLTKLERDYPGVTNVVKTAENTINNFRIAYQKAVARLEMLSEAYDEKTLKQQIEKELGKEKVTVQKKKETLTQFISRIIKEMEEGTRLTTKGKTFTKSTLKNYKGFEVQFKEFQRKRNRNVDFEDVTIDLRDALVNFFQSKNYSPNTIHRHIKQLKSLMSLAFELGLHANLEFQKRHFQTPQVETTEIYLTDAELDKIYELDLSANPHYDLARDVFLAGCYTAQRYSDYSRICSDHIKFTDGRARFIHLTQVKTGIPVVIPIRPKLEAILKKYDYNLPRTHEQKVNSYIKKVAAMAEITNPEEDDVFKNGRRSSQSKPKCDLVKTHTARRSGATNMYLSGIPVLSIMKVTGHKTEREFLKYIRITTQEHADSLSSHPYFS